MAYRKAFSHRFLSIATISSSSSIPSIATTNPFFFQNPTIPSNKTPLPIRGGDTMMSRIRESLRLDKPEEPENMSMEEVRKVLRAWQVEEVKKKLKGMGTLISYSEFLDACCGVVGGLESGADIARMLDSSGSVIVLGDVVFLQPDKVARAISGVLPLQVPSRRDDQQIKELKAMEKKKAEINAKAEAQVKRELQLGLGLFSLQTAYFMRLTFWELSWDVMEPICFFVTSFYFVSGYAFFLRTSCEPSFEGFFKSRIGTKERRLMQTHNFDLQKFDELKKAYYRSTSAPAT